MATPLRLEDIINADNFHRIQDAMAEATDMAMLTVDFAGKPVTPHSRCSAFCTLVRSRADLDEGCRRCDARGGIEAARLKQPAIYFCHMGLVDLAVPIILEGAYVGAILAGQVVVPSAEAAAELEVIAGRGPALEPAFAARLEALRLGLPVTSLGRVRAVARMLFQVSNSLVEEAHLRMRLASPPAPGTDRPAVENPLLKPALDHIRDHYAEPQKLEDMARLCRISPSYFSKLFNQVLGESFSAYVNRVRIVRARKLLVESDKPITVIALDLGFEDSSYFDKVFKRLVGETPSEYRKRVHAVQSYC
jgi:ligand-binding sensor protein/AraC-like DNA-binding protein